MGSPILSQMQFPPPARKFPPLATASSSSCLDLEAQVGLLVQEGMAPGSKSVPAKDQQWTPNRSSRWRLASACRIDPRADWLIAFVNRPA